MFATQSKSKLTAVSIKYNGVTQQEFLWLKQEGGKTVLSQGQLNGLLEKLKVPAGATYTIG